MTTTTLPPTPPPASAARRPSLVAQARVELRKLLTLRSTYIVAAMTVLLAAATTAGRIATEDPNVELPTATNRLELLGGTELISVLFVGLGALLTASEWRHHTAVGTFLAEPRRWRIVTTQVAVATIAGAIVAVAATAAIRLTAHIGLAAWDAPTSFGPDQWPTMAGAVLGSVAMTTIGAGLGTVLRNPALTAVAVGTGGLLIEMLFGFISTGLGEALSLPLAIQRLVVEDGSNPLQIEGLLTLTGWAAASLAAGIHRTTTADI
jgi:ABC-2 type transport system permease protein